MLALDVLKVHFLIYTQWFKRVSRYVAKTYMSEKIVKKTKIIPLVFCYFDDILI